MTRTNTNTEIRMAPPSIQTPKAIHHEWMLFLQSRVLLGVAVGDTVLHQFFLYQTLVGDTVLLPRARPALSRIWASALAPELLAPTAAPPMLTDRTASTPLAPTAHAHRSHCLHTPCTLLCHYATYCAVVHAHRCHCLHTACTYCAVVSTQTEQHLKCTNMIPLVIQMEISV